MKSRASWAIAPPSPPLSTISEVAPRPHCPTVQPNALGYHTLYTVPIAVTSNHHHQNITMSPHPHCANSTSTMHQELARVPHCTSYSCTNRHHQSSPVPKHAPFAHLYFAPAPSLYTCTSLDKLVRTSTGQACTRPCASRNSRSFYKLCKPLVRTNGNKNELTTRTSSYLSERTGSTAQTGTHPVHVQACTILVVCTSNYWLVPPWH